MSDANNSCCVAEDSAPRRYTRRLSDKVLGAFHQACDQADIDAATHLLQILETILERTPSHSAGNRRKNVENFVAAHERLWHLRRGG